MKGFRVNTLAAVVALALAACSSNSSSVSNSATDNVGNRNNLVSPNNNSVNNNSGSQTNNSANTNSGSQNNNSANNNSGSQNNNSANTNSGSQTNNSANTNSGSQTNNSANDNSGSQTNNSANDNSGSQNNNSANDNSGSQNNNSANNNSGSQTNNSANDNSGSQTNNSANDNSGSQTNNSANDNSGSQNNNSANNNSGSQETPPPATDHSAAIKAGIEKGFGGAAGNITRPEAFTDANGYSVSRFAADVVSISPDGSVKHQVIEDDKRGAESKSFTLNNVRIDLLNDEGENKKQQGGIPLRQFREYDLNKTSESGTLVYTADAKHPTNPSWVGSVGGDVYTWGKEIDGSGSYKNMRYGVFNDADGNSHLFVFGLPARVNRTSGSIEYAGSAIVGQNGKYDGLANAMTATANFDTKQVDVKISRENKGDLRFGGAIKGNSFEGTQNGIYTKGGFYGQAINATSTGSNLGGMFSVIEGAEKGVNGVYGGAQQKAK